MVEPHNKDSATLVEELLAVQMSRRASLHTIVLLAISIAENISVDFELYDFVDEELLEIPEKVVQLCRRLSEEQGLEAISRLAYELEQDDYLEENNVPR